MTLTELRSFLAEQPDANLHWMLPDGDFIPAHFHVTEVGRIQKDFIDCGGTTRSSLSCLLQIWVANDLDHRLSSGKLLKILDLATSLFPNSDVPVELEYEGQLISQFPIHAGEVTPNGLLFHLGSKHTDCLAKDKCGIPGLNTIECGTTGCC